MIVNRERVINILENYNIKAQRDLFNHSQLSEVEPSFKFPQIYLKSKQLRSRLNKEGKTEYYYDYVKFTNKGGVIFIENKELFSEYYDKGELYKGDELLNDILLYCKEQGYQIYDGFKEFKYYCRMFLNTDNKVFKRQVKTLKRKRLKLHCGHRFNIPNVKTFISNDWEIKLTVAIDNNLRFKMDKISKEISFIKGYNHDDVVSINISKIDANRRNKFRELYNENIPVETLSLLYRIKRRQVYKIIK